MDSGGLGGSLNSSVRSAHVAPSCLFCYRSVRHTRHYSPAVPGHPGPGHVTGTQRTPAGHVLYRRESIKLAVQLVIQLEGPSPVPRDRFVSDRGRTGSADRTFPNVAAPHWVPQGTAVEPVQSPVFEGSFGAIKTVLGGSFQAVKDCLGR